MIFYLILRFFSRAAKKYLFDLETCEALYEDYLETLTGG